MHKLQIFCLHFAGGNCYSFEFLRPVLSGIQLIPIELPGRGKRSSEPLIYNFEAAVQDIYDQITSYDLSRNYMIYGHSMGAYLGLKVTALLEQNDLAPAYLFVSGNPGPGLKNTKKPKLRHLMDDLEFKEELRTLGGISEEILNNKDLFNFIKPILKADFEIIETNEFDIDLIVKVPICAIMGSMEERSSEINNWANFTSVDFSSEIMQGNHFFIYENAKPLAHLIKKSAVTIYQLTDNL